jgi:hypothetical protein
MIRLIISVCLVLLSDVSFGQDCDVRIDPFTQERVVTYQFGMYIIFYMENNEVMLVYQFQFDGEMHREMPKGSVISFKFENGETMDLSLEINASPITRYDNINPLSPLVSAYLVKMKLTREQLKTFANLKMTFVRYPDMRGGFLTTDKSKRWVNNLQNGARCIQNNFVN